MTRFSPQQQSSQAWEASPKEGSLRARDGGQLDFRHYLMSSLFSLYSAPVSEAVTHILDVASGTDRWGHEIARRFPRATVVGVDRDSPSGGSKPPTNYRFVEGNVFHRLPFEDGAFGYVHQRSLGLVTPVAQWPTLLGELVRVTEPGGYIELRESRAGFENMGPQTQQVWYWWDKASSMVGIDLSLMTYLPNMLANLGLREIKYQSQKVGIGHWGGHRGQVVQVDLLATLHGLKSFICRQADISLETFAQVVSALPQEWEHYQTSCVYTMAYGQKHKILSVIQKIYMVEGKLYHASFEK